MVLLLWDFLTDDKDEMLPWLVRVKFYLNQMNKHLLVSKSIFISVGRMEESIYKNTVAFQICAVIHFFSKLL